MTSIPRKLWKEQVGRNAQFFNRPRRLQTVACQSEPADDKIEDSWDINTGDHTLLLSNVPPRSPYILGVQALRTTTWKVNSPSHRNDSTEETKEIAATQMEVEDDDASQQTEEQAQPANNITFGNASG